MNTVREHQTHSRERSHHLSNTSLMQCHLGSISYSELLQSASRHLCISNMKIILCQFHTVNCSSLRHGICVYQIWKLYYAHFIQWTAPVCVTASVYIKYENYIMPISYSELLQSASRHLCISNMKIILCPFHTVNCSSLRHGICVYQIWKLYYAHFIQWTAPVCVTASVYIKYENYIMPISYSELLQSASRHLCASNMQYLFRRTLKILKICLREHRNATRIKYINIKVSL